MLCWNAEVEAQVQGSEGPGRGCRPDIAILGFLVLLPYMRTYLSNTRPHVSSLAPACTGSTSLTACH